jgi:hypothetical protein
VHQCPARLRSHIGHANEVEYGKVFSIGAGNGVDSTQFANSVGCTDCAGPANARITSLNFGDLTTLLHMQKPLSRFDLVAGSSGRRITKRAPAAGSVHISPPWLRTV